MNGIRALCLLLCLLLIAIAFSNENKVVKTMIGCDTR